MTCGEGAMGWEGETIISYRSRRREGIRIVRFPLGSTRYNVGIGHAEPPHGAMGFCPEAGVRQGTCLGSRTLFPTFEAAKINRRIQWMYWLREG